MFFTAHVNRLKQTESGVPSERGSVARLVGTAWKQLSNDEKAYYEREADKHNGENPTDADEEEEIPLEYPMHDMAMHMHMPPPPEPHRHYYMYPPPYGYDYSQHHQRQARAQGYQQNYAPPRYDG